MGRPNIIDKLGLGPRVLTLAATMGSRQIADVLKQEGHKVGHMAVHRYLRAHLDERAEATQYVKAAVQAELQREALSDVQLLEKLRDMAIDALNRTPVEERVSREWAAVLAQARAVIETRLKVAGASDEDGVKVKLDLVTDADG